MRVEKELYRIYAQDDTTSLEALSNGEVTKERALEIGKEVAEFGSLPMYTVHELTTQKRWDEGCINFCPRCGTNLTLYGYTNEDYYECDACESEGRIGIELMTDD